MIKNLLYSIIGLPKAPNPIYLQIEPTNKCNLNCKMCFRKECPYPLNKDMPLSLFKKIVDTFSLRIIQLSGLGEPLLNKNLFKMIKYASLKGIHVELISNGTLIDGKKAEKIVSSGLKKITVSIDGINTYKKIRGVNPDKVIQGLKTLLAARGKKKFPKIYINTCILIDNRDDIPNVLETVDGLDVTVNLKTIRPTDSCKRLIDDNFIKNLKKKYKNITYSKYEKTPFCYRIWFGGFVNYNGDLFPCCNLFLPLGNILKDGWNSDKFVKFRDRFNRGFPKECSVCNITFNQRVHRFAKFLKFKPKAFPDN